MNCLCRGCISHRPAGVAVGVVVFATEEQPPLEVDFLPSCKECLNTVLNNTVRNPTQDQATKVYLRR